MIDFQGEIYEFTVIAGDLNTPLSEMDRFSRQKISKDIFELNTITNPLNTIDIYWLLNNNRTHIPLMFTWNIH